MISIESLGATILNEYINSKKSLNLIIKEHQRGDSKLVDLTHQIFLATYENQPFPKFDFDQLVEDDSCQDELSFFLFLMSWSYYGSLFDKREQAKSICNIAQGLQCYRDNFVCEFILKMQKYATYSYNSENLNANQILLELSQLKLPENLAFRLDMTLLNCYWVSDQAKEFYKKLNAMKSGQYYDELKIIGSFVFKLRNHIKFDLLNCIDDVRRSRSTLKSLGYAGIDWHLSSSLCRLHLYEDVSDIAISLGIDQHTWNTILASDWMLSTQYLLNGQKEKAMKHAQIHWDRYHHVPDGTFIRAQLSNRKKETAKKILEMKIENSGSNYLDDFYWARYYLLDRQYDKACQAFQKCVNYAKQYGCLERVKFELKMSNEISVCDFFDLTQYSTYFENRRDESKKLSEICETLRDRSNIQEKFIGSGSWYKKFIISLNKVAQTGHDVLIQGETGSGKELVARAIHDFSRRSSKEFISINCGSLQKTLLESELFGHVKGAFTGADKLRKGLIEEATGGTLFLDEIGDMPLELQVSLLRLIENREYRPVGSNTIKKARCCIIFATNVDLKEAISSKKFRSDLYYRLSSMIIKIPSLRERKDDITLLTKYFLKQGRADHMNVQVTPELMAVLKKYPWPGNVRELRNEIEYMKVMDQDKTLYGIEDLRGCFLETIDTKETDLGKRKITHNHHTSHAKSNASRKPIGKGNPSMRRLELLESIFKQYKNLTRMEICDLLTVSPATASKDLSTLIDKKVIERVEPSKSPRSHYFRYNENSVV